MLPCHPIKKLKTFKSAKKKRDYWQLSWYRWPRREWRKQLLGRVSQALEGPRQTRALAATLPEWPSFGRQSRSHQQCSGGFRIYQLVHFWGKGEIPIDGLIWLMLYRHYFPVDRTSTRHRVIHRGAVSAVLRALWDSGTCQGNRTACSMGDWLRLGRSRKCPPSGSVVRSTLWGPGRSNPGK